MPAMHNGDDCPQQQRSAAARLLDSEETGMLALAQEVDAHVSGLRSSVLSAVAAIRARILAQAADALQEQRAAAASRYDELAAALQKTQQALDAEVRRNERQGAANERLVRCLQAHKVQARQQATMRAAFAAWRTSVQRQRQHQRRVVALQASVQATDARRYFSAWRLRTCDLAASARASDLEATMTRELTRATSERQLLESRHALERLDLQERLRAEEERRAVLEQRLKAAFMRGVCALNLEAMRVLRGASAAGGASGGAAEGSAPNNINNNKENHFGPFGAATAAFNAAGAGAGGGGGVGSVEATFTDEAFLRMLADSQFEAAGAFAGLPHSGNNAQNNYFGGSNHANNAADDAQMQALFGRQQALQQALLQSQPSTNQHQNQHQQQQQTQSQQHIPHSSGGSSSRGPLRSVSSQQVPHAKQQLVQQPPPSSLRRSQPAPGPAAQYVDPRVTVNPAYAASRRAGGATK